VQLVFGIRKGLADDGLGIGVRDLLVGWVWAYREFCQPWLAAQRDAIGKIKVVYT